MAADAPVGQVPTAVVLAGGLGTRLRPVVSDRPKILASVGGRPFVTRLLDQLAAAGINTVVLCTGHLGHQVEAALGSRYHGLTLGYSHERTALGTGGAIRQALGQLASDPVIAMNGDSYCHSDLADLVRQHRSRAADVTMVVVEVPDAGRYGSVMLDGNDRIVGFAEKTVGAGPGWANAGVYVLNRALVEAIPAGRAVSLERELLPAWLTGRICGYRTEGPFIDIGTPESFAGAEAFFG
jgi:D-glycero-alpha-D-manno-heptose 1-phosphate guanylyltransferase